jgi:hypothetical protein
MLKRKREGSREKIGGDKIKYSKNIEWRGDRWKKEIRESADGMNKIMEGRNGKGY